MDDTVLTYEGTNRLREDPAMGVNLVSEADDIDRMELNRETQDTTARSCAKL